MPLQKLARTELSNTVNDDHIKNSYRLVTVAYALKQQITPNFEEGAELKAEFII